MEALQSTPDSGFRSVRGAVRTRLAAQQPQTARVPLWTALAPVGAILAIAGFVLLYFSPLITNADTFSTGDNKFDIEFVKIGDPGNPADTMGSPNPAGSVDYGYRMGKFEVSRLQPANMKRGCNGKFDIRGFYVG